MELLNRLRFVENSTSPKKTHIFENTRQRGPKYVYSIGNSKSSGVERALRLMQVHILAIPKFPHASEDVNKAKSASARSIFDPPTLILPVWLFVH